jgi:HEAT repeat protein
VPYLAALAGDSDVVVANTAVVGLAAVRSEASTAALRQALGDARFEVRANAAAALARRGIDAGIKEIEQMLDPAALHALDIRTPDARSSALVNGIVSVLDLRIERLKPKVEALTKDGDQRVRDYARRALEKWNAAK